MYNQAFGFGPLIRSRALFIQILILRLRLPLSNDLIAMEILQIDQPSLGTSPAPFKYHMAIKLPKMLQHASFALSDPEHGSSIATFLSQKLNLVTKTCDTISRPGFVGQDFARGNQRQPLVQLDINCQYSLLPFLPSSRPPPTPTPYDPKILHPPSPSELLKKRPLFHLGGAKPPATPLKSS